MSVLSEGFKLGNITINKEFIKTRTEMETLGNAEGYPDVFPIWCVDEEALYIFYRSDNGTANLLNYSNIVNSEEKAVMFPIINPDTNEISWEIRELTSEVPDPVTFTGNPGKSAYEVWVELGNTGTEQDFFNSLIPNFATLTTEQITILKTQLGLADLDAAILALNNSLDNLIN